MAEHVEDTKKKSDKRMSLRDAIAEYVFDGCSISFGGMGGEQVVAPTYEIIRQGFSDLVLIGDSPCECGDFLLGTGQVQRLEVAWLAYAVAGVSQCYRRAVEKEVPRPIEVLEFSNYTMGLRFLAGALGVPFMATKSLMGSSIAENNDLIKIIDDPYSGEKVALVPAANPDVAIVHVNRADMSGNAQLFGFSSNNENIARAASRTVITCEEIVSTEEIRKAPTLTCIPQYCVDAVVELPYCSHPWNMPYEYAYDIPFHMEMMSQVESEAGFREWIEKWAYGCEDHEHYCEQVGWHRLHRLSRIERVFCRAPLP